MLTYQMNNVYNFDNLLIAKLPEVVRANSGGALDAHTVAARMNLGLQPGAMRPQAECKRLHRAQPDLWPTGRAALVFCNSRKTTGNAAAALAKQLGGALLLLPLTLALTLPYPSPNPNPNPNPDPNPNPIT